MAEVMFSFNFFWILLSFWVFVSIRKCIANPIIEFLNNISTADGNLTELPSNRTTISGNTVILPLIIVIRDPKNISKILQDLGMDNFSSMYPDGTMNIVDKLRLSTSILPTIPPKNYICEHEKDTNESKQMTDDSTFQTTAEEVTGKNYLGPFGLGLLDVVRMPGPPLVRFWDAHKICSQHQMHLPYIKNHVDYINFRDVLDADKEYWIALTRAESPFVTKYKWLDGDVGNLKFLKIFKDFSPTNGPAEYCTINMRNGKKTVDVKCKTACMIAHYVCARQIVNKTIIVEK